MVFSIIPCFFLVLAIIGHVFAIIGWGRTFQKAGYAFGWAFLTLLPGGSYIIPFVFSRMNWPLEERAAMAQQFMPPAAQQNQPQ